MPLLPKYEKASRIKVGLTWDSDMKIEALEDALELASADVERLAKREQYAASLLDHAQWWRGSATMTEDQWLNLFDQWQAALAQVEGD